MIFTLIPRTPGKDMQIFKAQSKVKNIDKYFVLDIDGRFLDNNEFECSYELIILYCWSHPFGPSLWGKPSLIGIPPVMPVEIDHPCHHEKVCI
jgi:hypothetical protein